MASNANAAAATASAKRSGKPEGMTALATLFLFILGPQIRRLPAEWEFETPMRPNGCAGVQ